MAARADLDRLAPIGAALAAQGARLRPDLPWRRTRDPWAVLVSEVMAQQTQLSRVEPAYRSFLKRFPDPVSCAGAPLGDVLRQWSGLGYNRRARNLHQAAVTVTEEHGGTVPGTLPELLALSGVGPYTARAVLAFAFERDVGVVDTNAGRVLARAVAGRALSGREAQELADALVPDGAGWACNQALLDLGALVCVSGVPRCGSCPLESWCAWATAGRQQPDPARGTAGSSSPQGAFVGSERQGRGRLVAALRAGPIPVASVAVAAGWPDDEGRAERVLDQLVAEGLVVRRGAVLELP
ncbi:MAG: A/G-specific adenine glycosylase [Acidimicrobiales bacterium]